MLGTIRNRAKPILKTEWLGETALRELEAVEMPKTHVDEVLAKFIGEVLAKFFSGTLLP